MDVVIVLDVQNGNIQGVYGRMSPLIILKALIIEIRIIITEIFRHLYKNYFQKFVEREQME